MNSSEQISVKNIFEQGTWYHSVDFHDVSSKGTFDYRNLVTRLNFPEMKNLSVLDVGCSDGFFTKYFLESLNAKFVTGIDFNKYDGTVAFEVLNSYSKDYEKKYDNQNDYTKLFDDYNNLGLEDSNKFLLLKKVFNLNADYKEGSIYELSNFDNHDVTFCGSLLEHLRDPITAIEQLYLKTDKFCIIDVSNSFKNTFFSSRKPLLKYTASGGNFYHYSLPAIKSMMENIGFKNVTVLKKYKIKIEKYGYKIPHFVIIGYR